MDGAGFSGKRVAVLVDGDNITATQLGKVTDIAVLCGDPAVLRVYGHAERLQAWERGGFRPVLGGITKNAADMALTVDAMQLAYEGLVEDFVIVSSDRDFTYLVQHLRMMNRKVTLVCGPQAPSGLKAICSEVHVLAGAVAEEPPTPDVVKARPLSELDEAICAKIVECGQDGGIDIAVLETLMENSGLANQPRSGKWVSYFSSRKRTYRCDEANRVHLVAR